MVEKEAKARIKINKLLEDAGWRFFDKDGQKTNISLENNVKITQKDLDEFGHDFEKTKNGFVDFLLLDENSFPYAVLEAKAEDKEPLDGKEQARRYARSQNVRFVILSNGNLHYFWDIETGNPTLITSFPSPDSIEDSKAFIPNPKALIKEKIEEDYIAITQHPTYKSDPRWSDESQRTELIKETGLKFLRYYQIEAIQALQNKTKEGCCRYLFEMATGTGKTLTAAAVIKLFLRTGNAKRVLFLVDRLELEEQARKNLVRYLKNDYTTLIYKENRDDWNKAEIVVSTVQSLISDNKYQKLFSPTDFDLVISDEAHRSISGNSRAVFEYFIGYKLGLTATPKDYLKNLDKKKISERDPRQWERRQLLDSYITFGCEQGTPTYRYSLLDGVKDGYLINPIVSDARTEITTQLLSDTGYSVLEVNDDGELEERIFFQKDFERKFFSDKTNHSFCQTFLEHAIKDPISGEIGKSIIFCVSQQHASKITQLLNEYAHTLFPGKYNSDFAVQITSNIQLAQQMAVNFANNNLNGHTKWLDGYTSSKTRVCVTVGMMTTGYDCEDILNLGLLRPIFSPTNFIQMKGRGTRTYTFKYTRKQNGEKEDFTKEKEHFKLFDFFANCEYFEEKFNYDEVLELPSITGELPTDGDITVIIDDVTIHIPDPLKTIEETQVGLQGMKIDRKLFEQFEEKIKADEYIQETYQIGDLEAIEEYIKDHIFEKPEEYYNLEKIRKSIRIDRRLGIKEIIHKIFGQIERFKSKDELLEEEFAKFVSIYKPENKDIVLLKNYFKAYITDKEIQKIIEDREYTKLVTNPKLSTNELKRLGKKWINIIPEYVKDYVPVNTYM